MTAKFISFVRASLENYKVHLFQLTPDGLQIVPGSDKVIHQSRGSEANKIYKFNGSYYHLYSEDHLSEGRVVMMERSHSLDGPWEIRQLDKVNPSVDREPNQGGLIQIPSGEWWFLTHQGTTGYWEGRTMALLPVTWTEGWPIFGKPGPHGLGAMVWSAKKPISGFPIVWPQTDDDFREKTLSPQWEWNYQPRADKWSLSERPGSLRLYAFRPLVRDDLLKAGNTISQRSMRTDANQVSVKLDISGMADGERAGLCHFAGVYSWLGISQTGKIRKLTFNKNGTVTTGQTVTTKTIWLRSNWDYDGHSTYWYSLEGQRFQRFGGEWQLTWGGYRGDHVGIVNYNGDKDSGYLDIHSFTYTFSKPSGWVQRRQLAR